MTPEQKAKKLKQLGLSDSAASELAGLTKMELEQAAEILLGLTDPKHAQCQTIVAALKSFSDEDKEKIFIVRAPLTGIFYWAAAPNQPPFVSEGDTIDPETEVGLMEAMKVFSPIPYEGKRRARVAKVVASSGQLVSTGDPLLLLLPVDEDPEPEPRSGKDEMFPGG